MSASKNNSKTENLQIIYANVRSMRDKVEEIELLATIRLYPEIIILNETWLHEEESKYFNIRGYESVHNCRKNKKGGGTSILIKNGINFSIKLKNEKYNTLIVELLGLKSKLNIFTMYRAPDENVINYIEHLEYITDKYKNLIFVGDVNIDLLKNDTKCNSYKNTLTANSITLFNTIDIKHCTRLAQVTRKNHTYTSKTLIDHAWSNISPPDNYYKLNLFENPQFDHKILQLFYTSGNNTKRPMTNLSVPIFKKNLYITKISEKLLTENISNIHCLVDIISKAISESTTYKNIRVRETSNWITEEILTEMKIRNKLYKKL